MVSGLCPSEESVRRVISSINITKQTFFLDKVETCIDGNWIVCKQENEFLNPSINNQKEDNNPRSNTTECIKSSNHIYYA